jgi:hypothetical protein
VNQKINETDMLDMAKKMARSMAEEMIKNSPLVKEMAKEIAKEMMIGIKDNLNNIVIQNNNGLPQQKMDAAESNVFIDFKDEVELKSNMSNLGTVKEEKSDLSVSLEKMKRLKSKKT